MTQASLHKKVSGIILAAGTASRMGRTKQLLPYQGKPMLAHVLENVKQSRLHEVIVVLGHDADTIRQQVSLKGVIQADNPDHAKGQSTSVVKGISKVSTDSDGAMFLLADQPLITPEIINRILSGFETTDKPIVIPVYENIRGNPVIISRSLFPELTSLSGDTGARVLFEKFQSDILKINIQDSGILLDIDTQKDYESLLKKNNADDF